MADRVDYAMFFVNSFALIFYVFTICIWYGFFYKYNTSYYKIGASLETQ